ncbi:hypothetical protein BJV82DRAFT_667314 [Fennellomyces sp. T-0311]|nr:hypothetical protein BJV82DRAFT_667314 [Fennellomyces sp. T-0311]
MSDRGDPQLNRRLFDFRYQQPHGTWTPPVSGSNDIMMFPNSCTLQREILTYADFSPPIVDPGVLQRLRDTMKYISQPMTQGNEQDLSSNPSVLCSAYVPDGQSQHYNIIPEARAEVQDHWLNMYYCGSTKSYSSLQLDNRVVCRPTYTPPKMNSGDQSTPGTARDDRENGRRITPARPTWSQVISRSIQDEDRKSQKK